MLCLFVLCLFVCLSFCWLFVCLFVSFFAPCFFDLCLFFCLFVSLIALVLEVFLLLSCYYCTRSCSVVGCFYRRFHTEKPHGDTPPSPHPQTEKSHIPTFCHKQPSPRRHTPLVQKDYVTIEKDCKTHHFPPPRRQTRADSSLRPRGTVPELPSGTKACKTSISLSLSIAVSRSPAGG